MRAPTLLLASAALVAAQIPFDIVEYEIVEFDPIKYDGTLEPCAAVNIVLTAGETDLPAELAFACLNSVPVDVEGDRELIEELKLLWQFQSDIAWLQTPPDTWELGPTDLIAELDNIKNNLSQFPSEYAVQLAIWAITVHTGNFHFNYVPDILQVFSFKRNFTIAAISDDGKIFPKIYHTFDAIDLHDKAPGKFSPIKTINGEDVYKFLENVAARSTYSDLDGQLNSLYWKGAHEDSFGSFYSMEQYQGDWTNITFENGTSRSYENTATTKYDFADVVDGGSFFLKYCTGAISGYKDSLAGESKRRSLNKRTVIPTEYYPTAVAQDKSNLVAGYFLQSQSYQDTAVLKIISFNAEDVAAQLDFQATVKKFVAECVKNKKTKLVIDLRENGGGSTNILLDTVFQLFPKETPFSGQHNRVHEIYAAVADSVEEIYTNATLKQRFETFTGTKVEEYQYFRDWAYWLWTTVDGKNFKDMEDFVGPFLQHDDLVTSTWRYNLTPVASIRGDESFKFTNVTGVTPPFAKDNVVMLTDALCGSACASFHEELKNIVGIKSVVVGGRPRNGPTQAVTGTKGGEVRALYNIPYAAAQLINITENIGATTVLDTYVLDTALVSEVLVRVGDDSARVQFQEQIRKGDPTETPLQFIYEAADCKIFYTLKSLFEPEEAWKAAWNAFTDEKNCVAGSTRHKSSIGGGFKPYGSGPLKPGDMSANNSTRATLTSSARPTTHTEKPNISTAPLANPTFSRLAPSNSTATRSVGATGTIHATSTRSGVSVFTGAASVYGPGSVVAGMAAGVIAVFF